MNFLWNPLDWLSESGVLGVMEQAVRGLSFSLSSIIYKLIINLYDLFELLCKARLLDNSLAFEISKRIGLILGLVMFFNVVFSFVKIFVSPDTINDGEKGAVAIVKKILIVIVMLGCSNFLFNSLYKIQRIVVDEHIISNLLLPYKVEIGSNEEISFGAVLSEEMMYSFYQLENISVDGASNDDVDKIDACKNIVTSFRNQILYHNRFDLGYNCLTESVVVDISSSQQQEIFIINYNWLLSPVVGLVIVYLLLMYCFKIGVRAVQLMFLEIISPMAFVSYLSPKKDTMFSKWLKIYFSTYIDMFIRIAVINFIVFLVATILTTNPETGFDFWDSIGNPTNAYTVTFLKVVIVLALLTFAKKAPDLIKELFPAGASKLGFGASMKDIVGLQKGIGTVTGAGVGAAIGLIGGVAAGKNGLGKFTGALSGALGGVFRGGKSGFGAKNLGNAISTARTNQAKANLARAQRKYSGATISDSFSNWYHDFSGSLNPYQVLEGEVSSLNDLKADIEGEDAVKYAQQAHDTAYSHYVEQGGKASIDDWEHNRNIESGLTGGAVLTRNLKLAKDKTYKDLYNRGGSFYEKVKMHNRRFGTDYDESSHWNDYAKRDSNGKFVRDQNGNIIMLDGINTTRKKKSDDLEKVRAQQPKK